MKFICLGDQYIHRDEMPQYEDEDEIPPSTPVPTVDTQVGSSNGVGRSSFSLEENILSMNRRLEELFLLSNTCHEEVVGLIKGLNNRVSSLEDRFDEEFAHEDEDDDAMSAEF